MKILLLGPLKSQTGNFSTIHRVRDELADSGIDCKLECISSFGQPALLARYIHSNNLQCVIGMHAWRAGCLLQDCPVPFALIFGGTDLNINCDEKTKLAEMSKAVEKARFLIAFSAPMKNKAIVLWPSCRNKIIVQPQAVVVNPSTFSLKKALPNIPGVMEEDFLGHSKKSQSVIIFLLVAGLRRVKDPLFLAPVISEWHKEDKRVHLVIVGPELDASCSQEVKSFTSEFSGVMVLPAISKCDLHSAIRDSFALVNTSLSEGMSSAILEAMCLGVPVLARNIPGNSAIICNRETGFLFDTPQDFKSIAQELIASPALRERLKINAKRYVEQNHSIDDERQTYTELVNKLLT